MQSDPPTKESLSQLLISYIQYQKTRLDKDATDPPLTRLPMRCFLDFRPGGSLCHIFSTMYRYKADQRWRKFEFNATKTQPKDTDPNIQLSLETSLIEQNCLQLPVAYVRPEVDKELRNRITTILERHKCVLTADEEKATHIIYPEIVSLTILPRYAQPSFKRGKHALVLLATAIRLVEAKFI